MKNYLDLKCNVPVLRDDFELPVPADTTKTFLWMYTPNTVLTPEFTEYCKELIHEMCNKHDLMKHERIRNSFIDLCQIFYTPPKTERTIHKDGKNLWALNYPIPLDIDADMSWYRTDLVKDASALTVANTNYASFEPDEVELIEKHKINNLCLVNTGIPHDVINRDTRVRYVLSVRATMICNVLPFETMYTGLQNYAI
jgi:hypothetical protein